jgi:hypothetical protein
VIAALFVETGGCYFGLPGVDPWDESRDARLYDGPYPVVSHTPCQRWGKLWAGQPLFIKRTGIRKIKGDDGGCFAHSLYCVRRFGGIIEHPGARTHGRTSGLTGRHARADGSALISTADGPAASNRAATATTPASRRFCWPMAASFRNWIGASVSQGWTLL